MASDSVSQSYSNPEIMNSEQSDWSLQLSKLLSGMAQAQFDWASNEYDKGMGFTAQNVDRYLQSAGQGTALASQLMTQYKNVFEPIMNDYVAQAKSYNSPERQRFEMGRAESTVAQADQAARDEAERKLQGFGINPNSGRYQDLILTGRLQDAAARAGAGTEAALNTAAVGRQMTEKAAQMGQNVPGMTVNALNSANQGIAGAQNSMLGMMNTGANMRNSAANFGNAAGSANKLPQIGQKSASVSHSQNDGGSGSGSDKNKSGQGGLDKNPYPTDAYKDVRDFNNKGDSGYHAQGGGTQTGGIANVMHGDFNPSKPDEETGQPGGEPQWQGPEDTYWQGPQQGGDEGTDDFNSRFGGQEQGQEDFGGDDTGGQQEFNGSQDYDYGQGYTEPEQQDYSDDSGGDEGYAGGGGVLDTRTVPRSASQSGGRQTDDVPARLNVGEYVIPKDVVTHKGHEFFQNVIKKSRQSRLGMSGPEPRGQMKPALRMRPTFSTANRV